MNDTYNRWINRKLLRLESEYKKGGRPREVIKEAFFVCTSHKLPLPDWIIEGIAYFIEIPSLDRKLQTLEKAYQAGNYGALRDAVYWCRSYNQPLPEWANIGLFNALSGLVRDSKNNIFKSWRNWAAKYRQNMKDLEIYYDVIDANEHGTLDSAYDIAAGLASNKTEFEDGIADKETIKKTYDRVKKGMEENPLQYYLLTSIRMPTKHKQRNEKLWPWIHKKIENGKPKSSKKQRPD